MTTPPNAPPAAPAFRLSRESRIRIDRDGNFWHEGELVEHPGLARALATWIAIDPESDRYLLHNELDWCFITVDDAPLVARAARFEPDRVVLFLSDGTEEPLATETLRVTPEGVVYCDAKHGRIPVRCSRSASFALLETVDEPSLDAPEGPMLHLPSGPTRARRVADGAGAPKRAPARPDDPSA